MVDDLCGPMSGSEIANSSRITREEHAVREPASHNMLNADPASGRAFPMLLAKGEALPPPFDPSPAGGAVVPCTPAPSARRYGKRKLADARERFVAVRCNASEHAALTARAEAAGFSVGAYLRAVGIGAAGPRAVRRPPVERVELARLLAELGKVGSNVNQLAHQANTGHITAGDELAAASAAVLEMRGAVMKALGYGD